MPENQNSAMNFAVIIPSKKFMNLVPCVEAIHRHDPGHRLVVVDDGLACHPEILEGAEIVQGEKPFVFARNINIGIRHAIEVDPSVTGFILLNDDALLETPGGFTIMAQACKDHPEYGLIGAVCNNVGNPNQFPINGGGIYGAGLRGGALDGLRDEPRMVCFVCVYIPRTTIEAVGFLDERYTGYGMDDDDYAFEVRKAGLKIAVHDGCMVDHKSLPSSFRGPAGAGGDFRPNMKLFIEKWGHDNWNRPKETSQFAELFA